MRKISRIIVLLILVLCVVSFVACTKDTTPPPETPKEYELVFKIGDEYTKYAELEIPNGVNAVRTPQVYIRSTDLQVLDRIALHFDSDNSPNTVYIGDGQIAATEAQEFDELVTLVPDSSYYTLSKYGNPPLNDLQVRVYRDPIIGESLFLSYYDDSESVLQANSSRWIRATYTPANTSYKQTAYEITKVIDTNGDIVANENIAKYASIENDIYDANLITTDKIKAGYKIVVVGTSVHDQIKSPEYVVTIVE
jgi:hypothetical protein